MPIEGRGQGHGLSPAIGCRGSADPGGLRMPGGSRLRLAAVGLGLVLVCAPFARREAAGQEPNQSDRASQAEVQTIYYQSRAFRIPVTILPEVRSLVREVRLWVSDDRGYHWKEFGQNPPDRPEFPFRASRDGEFWFALQTVDQQGRIYPADDRQAEPSLKVVVDTAPPTIVLESQGRRGALAAVSWEAQDEYLLSRSFTLEFQVAGSDPNDWQAIPLRDTDLQLVGSSRADFKLIGSKTWDAGTSDPLRVRATVRDRAGNERQVEIDLPTGQASAPPAAKVNTRSFDEPPPVSPISTRTRSGRNEFAAVDDPFADFGADDESTAPETTPEPSRDPTPERPPAALTNAPAPAGERTLLAGSPRFQLHYEIEDAGPSGVAKVQLWVSHDGGRTWYPQPEDPDRVSPYNVDVGGEGTYGLWLAVQGHSGLGDPPPAPGDRPQMWVEVDSTPPVVQVDPPRPGAGSHAGKVLITWRASDPHLGPAPVTLYYRAEGNGNASWLPIAREIENSGQYIWSVPPGTPPRFRIKVEVEDLLGHRGAAESGPVLVDRNRPRGRIIGLDPANGQGGSEARR